MTTEQLKLLEKDLWAAADNLRANSDLSSEYAMPAQLLKHFSDIPRDARGDVLGKIYEYFLGEFALAEGQAVVTGE